MMLVNRYFPHFIIVFFFTLSWMACGTEEVGAPIKPKQMQSILFDLETAEAICSEPFAGGTLNKKDPDSLAHYYALVFKKYKIDEQSFKASMDWYLAHPAYAKEIFKGINDSATSIKGKFAGKSTMEVDTNFADTTAIKVLADSAAPVKYRPVRGSNLDHSRPIEETANPEDKARLEEIKRNNKAKQDALNKVKNEN